MGVRKVEVVVVVEFRVLGPLEIRGDDGLVALRGRHHPKLLALLLDEANRIVPVDRLIAGLWDEAPPDSARQQIQNVVGALRRQLGRGGERLRTVGGGYRFAVDAVELDVLRCKASESEARRLRADGRPREAVTVLRAALDEWRGPVLAGLEGRLVEAAAHRLEEYRLTLLETRIGIELDSGAGEALIAELRALTAEHPFRQCFTEQLMLALYRSGRTPEALQLYADLSKRLADELGTDPGRSLQDLHTAILRDDLSLNRVPPPPVPVAVPAMLPAVTTEFTGRTENLAALDDLLASSESTPAAAVLSGIGGVGKTALALHWAQQVTDRFPDGQLYVNLRGFDPEFAPLTPSDAACRLLEALGVEPDRIPADAETRLGLYRSLMARRRILLVADNAHDATQVRPLLPAQAGSLTLITSRAKLHGLVTSHGTRPLEVGLFSETEAMQLLERMIGKTRVAAEPEAAERIAEMCSGLPLALAIAAARAATRHRFRLADIADELEAQDPLDALAGEDPFSDLRTVFSWSFKALGEQTARLFAMVSMHPGPLVRPAVAASLAAVPPQRAKTLLAELAAANLLVEFQPGRYAFHDLIWLCARDLANDLDEAEREAAIKRMLDHYLHTAYSASRLIKPESEPIDLEPARNGVEPEPLTDAEQGIAWFTDERQQLVAAIALAADTGFDAAAWQLARLFMEFTFRQGYLDDGIATQRTALDAARRQADVAGQVFSHRVLATHLAASNDFERANRHLEQSLELCDQTKDRFTLAQVNLSMSHIHGQQRKYADAVRHGHRSLDLFRELDNQPWEAKALNAVGWYCAHLERYDEALEYCERAVELEFRFDSKASQASALDSLGLVHQRRGDLDQAIDCYHKSLDLSEQVGHRLNKAEALDHLGDAYEELGDTTAARAAWQRALNTLDGCGLYGLAEAVREKIGRLATQVTTDDGTSR